MNKHIKKFNDFIKENYSINENNSTKNSYDLTSQEVIDFANTLGHYEIMDNEEEDIDNIEDAIKYIELDSDFKVNKKSEDLYDIIEIDYNDTEAHDENVITKINFDDEVLVIKLISDGGFENFLYADTEDGESYVDISTNIENNKLLNAIWVKKGEIEEKIADMLPDFLHKSNAITKNGFNQYIKYDLK